MKGVSSVKFGAVDYDSAKIEKFFGKPKEGLFSHGETNLDVFKKRVGLPGDSSSGELHPILESLKQVGIEFKLDIKDNVKHPNNLEEYEEFTKALPETSMEILTTLHGKTIGRDLITKEDVFENSTKVTFGTRKKLGGGCSSLEIEEIDYNNLFKYISQRIVDNGKKAWRMYGEELI